MNETISGSLGPSREPNCGVTAVAVIAGLPFARVFEDMRVWNGRARNWKGRTFTFELRRALTNYGIMLQEKLLWERKCLKYTLDDLQPNTTYLVSVTGHIVTVRDGMFIDQKCRDWTDIRSHKKISRMLVKKVYEVLN